MEKADLTQIDIIFDATTAYAHEGDNSNHGQVKRKISFVFVISVITCLFGACLSLPVQPTLTVVEKDYFNSVAKKCGCKVSREVKFPRGLEESDPSKSDYYLLLLDSIDCKLLSDGALKEHGNELVRRLEDRVLSKSTVFSGKEVSVMYSCVLGNNLTPFKSFTYSREDLRNQLQKQLPSLR